MITLDTNVLSELMRPKPSVRVIAWVRKQPATELFTTSITEQKFSMELSCSLKANVVRVCWKRRKQCLPRIWRAESSDSRATRLVFSQRWRLTVMHLADQSAKRMRRSQPLPKCEELSWRRVISETSQTVALKSLTPGMVYKLPWFELRGNPSPEPQVPVATQVVNKR